MSPFYEATPIPNPALTPEVLVERFGITLEEAQRTVAKSLSCPLYKNDKYQVAVFRDEGPDGDASMIHLSIKRIDRQPVHDWRELQQIKNMLVGPECEGIELYPAESRLVDTANQYHLWVCSDPMFRIPVGFTTRMVHEEPLVGCVQRPFDQKEQA